MDVSTSSPKSNVQITSVISPVTPGTLGVLSAGDLSINGIAIATPVADGISVSDDQASAAALTTAINAAANGV